MTETKSSSRKKIKERLKLGEEYRIIAQIGSGGMAEVYKAEQVSLERLVAIKKLKSSLAENPEMLERFFREGKSAAHLQHENIVQVYQMGEAQKEHYLVMEYVEGRDLKNVLKTSGPLPWEIACLIVRQVAQGLDFAHQRGYIHRDIKPGNIMITTQGEVKIMDFGIVRRVDSELTQTGSFLGTPSYMSPEQLKGEGISPKSDLFSLGVVLYELVSGEKPFKAENEASLVQKIINQKPTTVRKHNPLVPRRVWRIIKRLLQKNPKKRFSSAQELIESLDRLLGRKLVLNVNQEIAQFLNQLQTQAEDKTKRVEEISSELVKIGKKRTAKKTRKKKTPPPAQEKELDWLAKTLILMIVIIAIILLFYFLHSHNYLDRIIEFFRTHLSFSSASSSFSASVSIPFFSSQSISCPIISKTSSLLLK